MAETVRGVKNVLQNELEKAKESLKDVDENIKKLTGRDPTGPRPIQRRVSLGASESAPVGDGAGRNVAVDNRLFNLARRGIIQDDRRTAGGGNLSRRGIVQEEGPVVQRRPSTGGAFARLGPRPGGRARGPRGRGRDSGDEDELPNRPALQSSVIATTNRDERSRQNSIEEQSRDRKGQARNRRMFGLLLGTLQRFKADAADSKEKEEQRIKIEKKLEEKFQQEKEEIIQERRQLFLARRQKQLRIRLLEQKMEMAQNHEEWEIETRKLENFIRTKAKPHIFYLPKALTDGSEAKLSATKKAVDEMVEQRRKKLENDIAEMMSQVHDDDDEGEEEGGDEGMDENRGDHSDREEEEMEGESTRAAAVEKPGDDKENSHRERRHSEKDVLEEEREQRDREREQRDKDRQLKEERRKERHERKEESGGRRKSERSLSRSKERDRSGEGRGVRGRHDKEKEKKGREKHRDGDHPRKDRERSRSRSRERHRSGKSRSDKRSRDYSDDEKSHGHSSKTKRRSKGEGKAEKKAKIWEPMEEEVEEEFVGGKSSEKEGEVGGGIASKMLALAGMSDVTELTAAAQNEDDVTVSEETEVGTSFAGTGDGVAVEDIPTPADDMPARGPGDVNIDKQNDEEKLEADDP